MRFIKRNILQLKNISFYFTASLIRALVSLAINPLIAMNMTHYDYALTGFYESFGSLFIPLLGFMFSQYYNRIHFKVDEFQRKKIATTLVSAQFLFGLIELILILIAFKIYSITQNIEFPFFPYAVLSFISIVFNNTYTFFLVFLKLKREAKKYLIFSIYNLILTTSLALSLIVVLKLGALGRILTTFITACVFGIFCFFKTTKQIYLNKQIILDAFKFCWPLIFANSLGYFIYGFDRALLVQLHDNTQLGLYNIAIRITSYLIIFQLSISQTFQPDIYEAAVQHKIRRLIKILFGINLLNFIPIILFIIMAPFILKILTADRYTEAYLFARILSLKIVTSSFYYSIKESITGYGYTIPLLIIEIIGSIISILLYKFLITKHGFYGAAWGQVLCFVGLLITSLCFILYRGLLNLKKNKSCF